MHGRGVPHDYLKEIFCIGALGRKHQPLKPMMHLSVCRAFKYLNLSLIISEAGSLRLLSPTKNKQQKSASPFCIVKRLSSHHQQHSVATKFPRGNMLWGVRCVTTEDFQAAGGLEGGTKGAQRIAKTQISPAKLRRFNMFRPKFYSETPWNVERFFKFHWSECMSNVCRIRFTKMQQSPTYLPIGVIFCHSMTSRGDEAILQRANDLQPGPHLVAVEWRIPPNYCHFNRKMMINNDHWW